MSSPLIHFPAHVSIFVYTQSKAAENQEEEKIENTVENVLWKVNIASSPWFFVTSRNHNSNLIPWLQCQSFLTLEYPHHKTIS